MLVSFISKDKSKAYYNLKKYNAEKLLTIFKKPESYFKKYNSYKEIEELEKYCKYYGVNFKFFPSLARGLSYYNGNVFEIKSIGMKETIAAGGSYSVNGIQSFGVAFGLDRIAKLAKLDKKILGQEILLTVGLTMKGFYGFILEQGASKYSKGFKRKHSAGEGAKNSAKFGQRLLPRPWFWGTIEKFWVKAPAVVESYINKVLGKYAN